MASSKPAPSAALMPIRIAEVVASSWPNRAGFEVVFGTGQRIVDFLKSPPAWREMSAVDRGDNVPFNPPAGPAGGGGGFPAPGRTRLPG